MAKARADASDGAFTKTEIPLPVRTSWTIRLPEDAKLDRACAWKGGLAVAAGGTVASLDAEGAVRWRTTLHRSVSSEAGLVAVGDVLVTHVPTGREKPDTLVVLDEEGEVRHRVALDHLLYDKDHLSVAGGEAFTAGPRPRKSAGWMCIDVATARIVARGEHERIYEGLVRSDNGFLGWVGSAPGLFRVGLDGATGDVIERDRVSGAAASASHLAIVVGEPETKRTLRVLATKTAEELWTTPVATHHVSISAGRVACLAARGKKAVATVRSLADGAVVFEHPIEELEWARVQLAGGLVAVWDEDGERLFDVERGRLLGEVERPAIWENDGVVLLVTGETLSRIEL